MKHWLLFGLLLSLGLTSCHDDADAPTIEPIPGAELPSNFPPAVYGPEQNPPDRATFELGRSLFYDPQLSRDGKVSCGSCHQQFAAFSQAGHTLSHGVDGRLGTRNSPALQNLRWKPSFMWDGGAHHIENQPIAPLMNPVEMDETMNGVLAKLNANAGYQKRFAAIYKRSPIDSYQLLRALAQFTAALTSSNSRYDHYVRHEAGGTLDAAELRGLALVQAKCASCHATDLFTDETFRNNGLSSSFPLDSGRAHITGLPADVGLFKVPSLRNVALTPPYMHDGRFASLAQVLAHYDHGVLASPTLDAALRPAGGRLGIALTALEQQDIIAFLQTLTDQEFISNKQLAEQP
ncbi:cytochrome c peroxidase [Hymenobacter sp. ASUV-10]|uniref:Cytochrome c peroxidase n=1 Tax=Hymenobacter aranciens TaxID=3063996 RepID=A0ABT9BG43_9BACT|nr:cytochrome c peroxidase [Hymenobacter sp. ASUV-10]MDO7876760.1 cytochrome c peroxidase [Hymenobacter sp. ASUV-10]